jgi:hypothetical protein
LPAAVYLLAAACLHPLQRADRLECWPRCWREGSTPALKDRLALTHVANWGDLQRVADFLRAEGVGGGEVICYSWPAVPLYRDLDLAPRRGSPSSISLWSCSPDTGRSFATP